MPRAPQIVIDRLETALDAVASDRWPCERQAENGNKACTDLSPPNLGWHEYNVAKMCRACACYWHLSCARNFALGLHV